MLVTSESLLGLRVLDARGQDVGVVVDVGTGERYAPKFLIIGPVDAAAPRPHPIVRVDMREVEELQPGALRLRPLPGGN